MQITLKAAFKVFRRENPDIKLSYTRFTLKRPKNVRLLSHAFHNVCLCPYCMNIKYKVLALNRAVALAGVPTEKLDDERALYNMLLCSKSEESRFHDAACVKGTCDRCKHYGQTIRNHYQALLIQGSSAVNCTWNHWERTDAKMEKFVELCRPNRSLQKLPSKN